MGLLNNIAARAQALATELQQYAADNPGDSGKPFLERIIRNVMEHILEQDYTEKADKVVGTDVEGQVPVLDSEGNLSLGGLTGAALSLYEKWKINSLHQDESTEGNLPELTETHPRMIRDSGKPSSLLVVDAWDDMLSPVTGINLPGTPADPIWNSTLATLDFQNAKTHVAQIVYQMSHQHKQGTDVRFHLHWQPSNTNTGACSWTIKYQWRNTMGDVADTVGTGGWASTTVNLTPGGVAGVVQVDELVVLSKPLTTVSSLIQIQVQRNGTTDAFTGNAQVLAFDLHYQKDTNGSATEYSK
jgi:hypothetical protein